jgi:DNA-binding NarL/FixJ family response regulator
MDPSRNLPDAAVIRTIIADDQELVRTGLRTILEVQPDIEIVGEAADGSEAVSRATRAAPDVVIMDIRMPVVDGIEATSRIAQALPGTRVLILTSYGLDQYVYETLRAGAAGFLLKTDRPERIVDAVRAVASGEALLGPDTTRRLIERFVQGPVPDPPEPSALTALTPREREVLLLVARGLSNQQIADRLFIGDGTVKTHVARLLAKLQLHDRVQVIIYAYETGLVRPGFNDPR